MIKNNGSIFKLIRMKVVSLFSGCGGLDLGFRNAGFEIIYANDNDSAVWETYKKNHGMEIDTRCIKGIVANSLPDAEGFIGGPPCQSWSLGGKLEGFNDERGLLFLEYIRILREKKPLFFVAENVPGIMSKRNEKEFKKILSELKRIGYRVNPKLVDARDYGVPQVRKRVIIIGYRKDIKKKIIFPKATHVKELNELAVKKGLKKWVTLEEIIRDLPEATPAKEKNYANLSLKVANHEYLNGGFSYIYMSRNRRKTWNEQSYTIQASGRQAPLHPDSPKMKFVGKDMWVFERSEGTPRRLSVRECARIQTFPDDFIFNYKSVNDGYRMVGNAVPIKLAEAIANKIKTDFKNMGY